MTEQEVLAVLGEPEGRHPDWHGQPVPLNAHHANLHTGRAGEALWNAGNAAVPVFPGHTPWRNCDVLMEFFFGS